MDEAVPPPTPPAPRTYRVAESGRSIVSAMGVSGLCLGWLMGISVSPTASTVVGAALGVVAALSSGLSAVRPRRESNWRLSGGAAAWPLAVLLLGIALGTPAGIFARTHRWFDRTDADEVKALEALGVGASEARVMVMRKRYLELRPSDLGVLYGAEGGTACEGLAGLPPEMLANALGSQFPDRLSRVSACSTDAACLEAIRKEVCK